MWLNMVVVHQLAVALPQNIAPATARIAVGFIMVDIGGMKWLTLQELQ